MKSSPQQCLLLAWHDTKKFSEEKSRTKEVGIEKNSSLTCSAD
jgi:hypothetical protein